MEHATATTKSFLIALALVKRHLTVEQAASSARVEVASQIERWGEVEDCMSLNMFMSVSFLTHCNSPRYGFPRYQASVRQCRMFVVPYMTWKHTFSA